MYGMYGAYAPYGLVLSPTPFSDESVEGVSYHLAHAADVPVPPIVERELPELLNLIGVDLEGVADHLSPGGRRGRTPRTGRTGFFRDCWGLGRRCRSMLSSLFRGILASCVRVRSRGRGWLRLRRKLPGPRRFPVCFLRREEV